MSKYQIFRCGNGFFRPLISPNFRDTFKKTQSLHFAAAKVQCRIQVKQHVIYPLVI